MKKSEHDPHIIDKIIGVILFLVVAGGFIFGILKLSEKTIPQKPIIKKELHIPNDFKFTCVRCGCENTRSIFDMIDTTKLDSIQKAAWKK